MSASICKAVEQGGPRVGGLILSYQLTLSQLGWADYAKPEYYLPLWIFRLSNCLTFDDVSSVSAAFQSEIAYLAENSLLVDLFRQTAGIKYLNTPQKFWHFRFRNAYKKNGQKIRKTNEIRLT